LSYFAKPNFIVYDEWFDNDLKKTKLDFKNKKFKKLALGNIPMGKAATESDVATTVCFLASSASSMITGTSIIIDGGWTAQ